MSTYKKISALICLLSVLVCGHAASQDVEHLVFLSLPQLASFHIGVSADSMGGAPQAGLNLGASLGINHLGFLPMGARIKYFYANTQYVSHSVGCIFYGYLPGNVGRIPYPIALAFGAGGVFALQDGNTVSGEYVEAGIGLFKLFPLLNVDLLYRASFFPQPNPFNLSPVVHSVNLVFSIL